MAKKAKKRAPKELTRKQRSRLERENRIEKILIWSVIAVTVVVVGVLAYGFIVEKVVKAREPVAIVGDTPITTGEFQARVRFTRMQLNNQLQYMLMQQQALNVTDPDTQFLLEYVQGNIRDLREQLAPESAGIIGEQVFEDLIQQVLVRQEAERLGIDVSQEELQREIELSFDYDRNPETPTPAPTATPPLTPTEATLVPTIVPQPTPTPITEEDFRQRYGDFLDGLKEIGVSEQLFRSWMKASLLMEKVQEQKQSEIPTTADQVKLFYLTVEDQEQADELAARLDADEDPQALADELSAEEPVTGYGYELSWFPRSVVEDRLGAELAEHAFSLTVGEHSQPVLNQESARYAIIKVLGHEERELEESLLEQMGKEAFQEWLDIQMEESVERRTYRDRVPTDPQPARE